MPGEGCGSPDEPWLRRSTYRGFDTIASDRRRKQLVAVLVIATLAFGITPMVVSAQPTDDRQTEAKQDVEALQNKLEDAVERYNYACSKLEQTQAAIEQNQAELEQAEAELSANKQRLNDRVRAMYVARHNEFLDVVVNAGNFDEFLVGMDLAKKIGEKDAELVAKVKDAKAKLEAAKAALAEQQAEQQAAREEMAASKASVESDLAGAKDKLVGIEEEIRQAMARRAEEAASASRRSDPDSDDSGSYVPSPVTRREHPPGAPNDGVVGVAYDQLGKPYVWGAGGPDSFDCSGLTMYCYEVGAGKSITHSSYGQAGCGTPVSVDELQPGDILGFRGWGHVGIYIGGGQYIHAPQSGDVVKVSNLADRGNFCGAVRP